VTGDGNPTWQVGGTIVCGFLLKASMETRQPTPCHPRPLMPAALRRNQKVRTVLQLLPSEAPRQGFLHLQIAELGQVLQGPSLRAPRAGVH